MSERHKKLDDISSALGISKAKRTTFKLEQIDEKEMKLTINKGNIDLANPWFGVSSSGEECALISAALFEALLNSLKNAQKENFELKLERSIWQHIPVDFGDVWSVAINEIKSKKFKKEPNLDQIIKKIKREHPNLFVDMQNLIHTNKEIQ
ncbi:DUF2603 domain-containing protein [Campylobacter hyointestinalis subsp. hyointestinalis]|uniref:UPF0763 protein ERS739223_01170 n=1 Tax=Campylobacter hyointestinalis subsp. hyointestinalis TaxID=91352 RepID=A0A9W5EYT5_CAMHY|nr:DUF2603 domain-containing protein [Campylobacter hyointestinalis]PPB58200.1 hypothetical protein CDQ71_04670 [Campylobacter hyointestinalis subsp. hyointestinalis]PPB66717.1 hypothetical protein CDQ75_04550 [Campylobacter hyointestinalis subsp. hyointestinalis]PPB68431.1 hypothetical protein CDQ76_04735 [Campylobacter hyointestinalis subsp. hyointestinalis]QCU00588.1 DUF2603 domain-containing protein [Campylobacter hyointestinalis subsp. hyointestinalis]TWO22350.1 DUF2603 domain-containing 